MLGALVIEDRNLPLRSTRVRLLELLPLSGVVDCLEHEGTDDTQAAPGGLKPARGEPHEGSLQPLTDSVGATDEILGGDHDVVEVHPERMHVPVAEGGNRRTGETSVTDHVVRFGTTELEAVPIEGLLLDDHDPLSVREPHQAEERRGFSREGEPHLAALEPNPAVGQDLTLQIVCARQVRSGVGLRESDAGDHLARSEKRQPLFLLLLGAEGFHTASEDLGACRE